MRPQQLGSVGIVVWKRNFLHIQACFLGHKKQFLCSATANSDSISRSRSVPRVCPSKWHGVVLLYENIIWGGSEEKEKQPKTKHKWSRFNGILQSSHDWVLQWLIYARCFDMFFHLWKTRSGLQYVCLRRNIWFYCGQVQTGVNFNFFLKGVSYWWEWKSL